MNNHNRGFFQTLLSLQLGSVVLCIACLFWLIPGQFRVFYGVIIVHAVVLVLVAKKFGSFNDLKFISLVILMAIAAIVFSVYVIIFGHALIVR